MSRRLTPSQRALRQLLRRARPLRRRVELAELDARWLAEALFAAEPEPVRITMRGVAGARALEDVRGTPLAGDCLRKAGISEDTTPDEVLAVTLARFAGAIAWLRGQGVEIAAYVNAAGIVFACDSVLSGGVPLEELAA